MVRLVSSDTTFSLTGYVNSCTREPSRLSAFMAKWGVIRFPPLMMEEAVVTSWMGVIWNDCPKGDRGQFHQAHIFLLMHNGGRLPGKVDACFPQQAELLEIIVKTLRSQPLSHIDEHRITGVHGSL